MRIKCYVAATLGIGAQGIEKFELLKFDCTAFTGLKTKNISVCQTVNVFQVLFKLCMGLKLIIYFVINDRELNATAQPSRMHKICLQPLYLFFYFCNIIKIKLFDFWTDLLFGFLIRFHTIFFIFLNDVFIQIDSFHHTLNIAILSIQVPIQLRTDLNQILDNIQPLFLHSILRLFT